MLTRPQIRIFPGLPKSVASIHIHVRASSVRAQRQTRRRPLQLHHVLNARLDRRVAERLQRSSRKPAPPTFQDQARIRLGFDRQRHREAAALLANRLEGLPVRQGDVRFKTHVEIPY